MNYELLYTQLSKELGEAKRTISDNNEFFAGQMMVLNDQVMTKNADIARLKQDITLLEKQLKRKSLQ